MSISSSSPSSLTANSRADSGEGPGATRRAVSVDDTGKAVLTRTSEFIDGAEDEEAPPAPPPPPPPSASPPLLGCARCRGREYSGLHLPSLFSCHSSLVRPSSPAWEAAAEEVECGPRWPPPDECDGSLSCR